MLLKNKYKVLEEYIIIYIDRKNKSPLETYIDIDDFNKIKDFPYKFTASKFKTPDDYYVLACVYLGVINGKSRYKTVRLSRLVMQCLDNDNVVVDHINHNTLDNRKSNLRLVTINQNTKHRGRKNKNNTSGYRNVSRINNKWVVQLQIDGKNKILGKFENIDEAKLYAEEMRKIYYKEFAGN